MLTVQALTEAAAARFIDRAQAVDDAVLERAGAIVAEVRSEGDAALRRWTLQLDGVDLEQPFLDDEAWEAGASACPPEVQAAIDGNLARIQAFHALQTGAEQTLETAPGLTLGRRPVPHAVAACYVPGGRASYPSSVLMTVAPARIAGVERIIVVTPPRPDGTVDPAVLYAARAAGATDVLRAGGAQAIAALAHGTDGIPRADCIVGPGNAYVTAAKRIVGDAVGTDSPAGPSELLVLADASAQPVPIALDLIAQAEHDPDAQCILVTDDAALAAAVADELTARVPVADRADIVAASLRDHGALLVAESMDAAIDFTNAYAAEHLEIHTADPRATLARTRNAGSIFLGPHTPVPLGDYGSGTNHVLPTMGFARIRGGLAVDDFRKWITWQEATEAGLAAVASDVVTLARAEGLSGHAEAVAGRFP